MSTRFSAASSTNIWEHLNGLDDDLIAHDTRLDAVEAALADDGRVAFALSGVAGTGWYWVRGDEIEVRIETSATLAASTASTVYTLPTEIRPDANTPMAAVALVGSPPVRPAFGNITAGGAITIYNAHTGAAAIAARAVYRKPPA